MYIYDNIFAEFFLKWQMFQEKFLEKIKTFYVQESFFPP
jgi:hypothetical protein